ncbi:hypothetical protein PRUPE_3G066600 [Prunus persica]|uniref:Uncharacterized protein n=1 Tax=Prunus persica TaxID=3760 RepID=A0A251PXN3_PRUPE|nr:hypothetical protein PRUPE_3G066600 [Prunus persica]
MSFREFWGFFSREFLAKKDYQASQKKLVHHRYVFIQFHTRLKNCVRRLLRILGFFPPKEFLTKMDHQASQEKLAHRREFLTKKDYQASQKKLAHHRYVFLQFHTRLKNCVQFHIRLKNGL